MMGLKSRFWRTLRGLPLVMLLISCAMVQPVPPEVNLVALEVQELTLSHANMLANLRIFNPNQVALDIREVDYALFLNGIRVSSGRTAKGVSIDAEKSGEIALRLSSAYWDMLRVVNQAQAGKDIGFKILGSVKVGGFGILGKTFKFEREGAIPLEGIQP